MIVVILLLLALPAASHAVKTERVTRAVESLSTVALLPELFVTDALAQWLSGNSRHSDDAPVDSSKAIVKEEEDESDDTKVFGMDIRCCSVADPVSLQSHSLRSCAPSPAAGSTARLPLRC
jgi:hypothetical protein